MYISTIHNMWSIYLWIYLFAADTIVVPLYLYCRLAAMWKRCQAFSFLYSCDLQSIGCCLSLSSRSFFILPAFRCSANFIFPPSLHLSPFESLAFTTSNILPAHYIVHHVEPRLFSCRRCFQLAPWQILIYKQGSLVTAVDIAQILHGRAP